MKILSWVISVCIGAMFLFSGYSKLTSIDSFEVYLYRSSFLDFDFATISARLLIGLEWFIGLGLISRIKFKTSWLLAVLVTLVFSVFLALQLMSGSDENCFCFGEIMEFSPLESLLKNAVIVALLLIIKQREGFSFKRSGLVYLVMALLIVSTPFIYSPPDMFVQGRLSVAQHDQKELNENIRNRSIPEDFVLDKKLVAFYSMGCRFCKMSSERLTALVNKEGIDTSLVKVVFWESKSRKPSEFFEETHSIHFRNIQLPTKPYLGITKGRMPLILLIENGLVAHQMNYRDMDEELITNFLLK